MGQCFRKKQKPNPPFTDNKNDKIDFQKISDDTISATEPSDLELSAVGAFDRKAKEQEMAALNT